MRTNDSNAIRLLALRAVSILSFAAVAAFGQQQINLTAGPTTTTLPDGTVVPMWGYSCGAVVTGSTATCAALNPNAPVAVPATTTTPAIPGWSPVVITVPTGATGGLTINLTNNLTFANANTVPTSIVIVGQVGGGLGTVRTTTPSPLHATQQVTWPTASSGPTNVPPPQGPRVQSLATEVAGGATTLLPAWPLLKPGTYLLESGTHPSIQVPMGLYGILVVTAAPTAAAGVETAAGTAYPAVAATSTSAAVPAVTYDAEIPLEFSEIDAVQNKAVNVAVNSVGFSETTVWSGQPGGCGNPGTANAGNCYPPAVNYTPLYYLINGVALNKTSAVTSTFAVTPANIAPAAGTTGNVLVRFVNAGLRMHVPSIVGSQVAGETGATTPVVTGFKIVAEDGNPVPGLPKVKTDVFMAAGKTFDVLINGEATTGTAIASYPAALPVYDRELSLSGNATARDAGMLAYIAINGAALPVTAGTGVFTAAVARADTYNAVVAGQTLTVSDPSKGVIANDTNVYGVALLTPPANGTVNLNRNGTFVYVANAGTTSDSFTYCANGTVTGTTCSSGITATVTLGASNITDAGVTCAATSFTSNLATYLAVKTPGVLAGCKDGANLPVTVVPSSIAASGFTVLADANGGFTAIAPGAGSYSFTFQAKNSHGVLSAATTVALTFPAGSGLAVTVLDGKDKATAISDYRWIIEEDRTFYINPNCTTNPPPAGCPTSTSGIVPTLGVNFHTSNMPFVAQGCTGPYSCESGQTVLGVASVCDVSNGVCRPDPTGNGQTAVLPSQVHLDPTKRYYISVLPGDAANPFYGASATGHGMGGAPIGIDPNTGVQQTAVTIYAQPSPYPPSKLSVFVFEDDFPLNGEQDGGGGIDVLSPNEPGLGGFQIHLWDAMGGNGDFTGQMTYDMFNQPLSNSLAGTLDPVTGHDACPISKQATSDPTQAGITGMIVTCPKYEADGKTLSPLAGQAVIANLMPGRFGVIATPAADRIARGEEWLQTNTLDGQKAHDSFVRIGEPSYFQEFGPASFHVSIGFANPAIINARHASVCNGTNPNITGNCSPGNTLTGKVTGQRLSRTPDERLYSSGSHDTFYWSQCYVSFGDPDGIDFAFTKCAADGTFTLTGLPDGDWRITTFDQWNDQLVDGLSTPVRLGSATSVCPGTGSSQHTCNMGDIAATQWQTNLYTRTFIDDNKDGIAQATEAGIPFANVAVRLRDGSLENLNVTDFTGTANFNETFPLFSWYTVETDTTRYKNTGIHVVYDAGGPADGTLTTCGGTLSGTGYPPCGRSTIGKFLANTSEQVSVPASLRIPGAVYCGLSATADCNGKSIQNGPGTSDASNCTLAAAGSTTPGATCATTPTLSTGRIDPPWVGVEGWQGFPGQNNFLEFGKEPYIAGENGGIKGHVVYASTRPFDDPQMLVQTQWEPLVPHVTINLYKEGFATDGVTPTLTLVDTTQTSSFDDWAQGFRADGVTPNMSCPGQGSNVAPLPDLFFFSLYDQPDYLNLYNAQHAVPGVLTSTATGTPLPANSQFKCYDGMHNWNQLQPAPYDGMYQFPSVTAVDANGKPSATNCTICNPDPVPAPDLYAGVPMLPAGKYVVEVVLPPGYELVKEEDKNILIGDNFIAPVVQEFGGLGNIFIMPDQASVAASQQYPGAGYNANNAQNPTQSLGTSPSNNIVPGFIPEPTWPCVGEARIVPDFISLYPLSSQVAPFAGATRNLCDRKEVTLNDQMGAIAKFYIYTSTHIASKFTGGITDDYTSEFDPFSPQFGEKFAPPDLPISVKDWTGTEISRVYADHWGAYNGMTYSTWEVNPPNPTGYSPTMMVFCMNDPGPIKDTRVGSATNGQLITDPLFAQGYSQFCYELPFMPGTTQYLDTPVVPTSAFAGAGYNNVDCAYPTLTPAVAEVDGDGVGPWVSAAGHTLTITALGDQVVPNNAYSGPAANAAPYNEKTITRHYGFGAAQGTGSVTIGGVNAPVTSWSDTSIKVTVPSTVPACAIQQQAQYGGSSAKCGQLVITAGNGQKSIDAVTVTVGGKTPTHVPASGTIQSAIDAASPGDLIIVDPTCVTTGSTTQVACAAVGGATTNTIAAHNELLLMWKPVRLQGVGAATSIINANTHPAGKLDPWRQQVDCLFGIAMNGTPISATNKFDPSGASTCPGAGWKYFTPSTNNPQVDRLPTEATLGWDASLNGNLAEMLQEPSLMGALEGAAITVLAKGVFFPSNPWVTTGATFPTGTTLLQNAGSGTSSHCTTTPNPYPSNFMCNPSSIDGLGITDSSQGGGGIFVHAWGHNLQIANNRIYNNAGTLSGGINVGQGEFPPAYLAGSATNSAPGSCQSSSVANTVLPYCHNLNVNVHNNYVALNSSTGDELFSATPAGAGGVSFCTGADYYLFNYNWVCGNLSSGDGGGLGHLGLSYNGDIEHNWILFNQSTNPTIPANGGGIIVMGAPDADPTCGGVTDSDCVPALGSIGPSDGIGPNLVINANLIMGNAAESGTGGGISFQNVNGSDVVSFPTRPQNWWSVNVTNNIIANNVAGWDGGGVSLLDAFAVNFTNNTVASNNTTASAGVLFNTIGAPLASQSGPTCTSACGTVSQPQPAGLVVLQNSATLMANLPAATGGGAAITCPANHPNCGKVSSPLLSNDLFWQNSAYYIGVGALSPAYQQNVVTLYNGFTSTVAPSQATTGACVAASYWDIGVRGDTGPGNHTSTITLAPTYSILTNASENGTGTNNLLGSNPAFISQYCNGSRVPPEYATSLGQPGAGWAVPPGISDATVPNPIFNLTPVATVDEGNNWVNMRWGPLTLSNPSSTAAATVLSTPLGNYAIAAGSPAINHIPVSVGHPSTDFFGNPRPDPANTSFFDVGAVEVQGSGGAGGNAPTLTSITPNTGAQSSTVSVTLAGTNLAGATWSTATTTAYPQLTFGALTVNAAGTSATASITIAATATLGAKNLSVTTAGGTSNTVAFTVVVNPLAPTLTSITPATGVRGTSVPVTLTGTNLTGATSVTAIAQPNITVTAFVAVSATTVTATLNLGPATTLGVHAITVTTPNGTAAINFTVTGATVAFTGPAPALTTGTTTTHTGLVTVSNGAAATGPLTMTAAPTVVKVGAGGGTFSVVAGGSCTSTTVLAAGQSCTVNVQYVPGASTATATAHITITGTGLAAATLNSANFTAN